MKVEKIQKTQINYICITLHQENTTYKRKHKKKTKQNKMHQKNTTHTPQTNRKDG